AGSVIRVAFQKDGELSQGAIEITLVGVFHGEAVASEGIIRILCENVVQCGNAVHKNSGQCSETRAWLRKRLLQTSISKSPTGLKVDWRDVCRISTMASPEILAEVVPRGVSVFHANGKVREWSVAASGAVAARVRMDGSVHCAGA